MIVKKILLGSVMCLGFVSVSVQAGDTLLTNLDACRDMALHAGASAKATPPRFRMLSTRCIPG